VSNTQQLLQQTLSNWQSWQVEGFTLCSQPQPIRELPGGKTNRSFLVASGGFEAVVRINAANSQSLGIDRNREQKILQLLQSTGTVPRLFFIDEQVMVSRYYPGQYWVDTAKNRRDFNAALAQIQAVAIPELKKRNYVEYCSAYINQLNPDHDMGLAYRPMVREILSAASVLDNSDWTPVISHHDLVPENIIVTAEGLKLLDWEYAAMGHPALDYMHLYPIDLISTNLGYDRGSIEPLKIVQRGMNDLWSLVQS
jgi:thiamine kinase-like enzyme